MNRTPNRHRTRNLPHLGHSSSIREDPPSYLTSAAGESPDEEDRLEELFRYLRAIESEPTSTLSRQLIADGIELPAPRLFTDESVSDKLWEVLHGLARRRHFLSSTNHLSDLDLYRYLWEITLNEPSHELDDQMGECACHIDLVSDGSEESIWLWLRYYADESTRQEWAGDFPGGPGGPMPPHIDPPFDRDRQLPQPFSQQP